MSQIHTSSTSSPPPPVVPTQFNGNTGSAVPAANILNVVGTGNINVTAAGNTLTIADSQSQVAPSYTSITVANSPYTVLSTDYYISVDSSGGAVTVRLPNAPTQYRLFTVKDRTGSANTNSITITTVGGVVLIDGSTSYTFNQQYEAADLIFNGTSYEVF